MKTAFMATQLLFLGFVLLLSGCGETPRLSALSEDAVLLAFGDSLTHGSGARPEESYPAVLQGLIGRHVIRSGVPGETSAEGMERLEKVLAQHAPDIVLLCHGGNDLLQRLDKEQLRANLKAMIDRIRASGAEVILIGVSAPIPFFSASEHYDDVADQTGVVYEDTIIGNILADRALRSDQVHPNAKGYQVLAEAIAQRLREHGGVQ
ncbi:MAG: arylesterase [Gammaproteobacteria bacterium]